MSPAKLDLARQVGADEALPSDESAVAAVRDLTGGTGASLVPDFVGDPATVALAGRMAGAAGDVTIVGLGGGTLPVGYGTVPFGCTVTMPYWGTRPELLDLVELARRGAVSVHVETYCVDDAPLAYERLRAGTIQGRAVIVP